MATELDVTRGAINRCLQWYESMGRWARYSHLHGQLEGRLAVPLSSTRTGGPGA